MPPKKVSAAPAVKKATAPKTHGPFKDMITDAIRNLKERNGSSRQSIKKYVQANNKISSVSQQAFDTQFNRAIKTGVDNGIFTQPKGPSGPVKLAKKEPAEKAAKPAATKKVAAEKKEKKVVAAPKEKKAPATKPKKAAATKEKKVTAKPKANTAKPRKAPDAKAPAVVDQPKVLGKTKSGRVTKGPAKSTTTKKAGAPKKGAPKKVTPKKKAEASA